MSKKRLYEIAKELGKESKEVVTRAKELGFDVKSHASSVDTDAAEKLMKSFAAKKETVEKKVAEVAAKATAVVEKKEAVPVKNQEKTETKLETPNPVAKPKSRNFKAEREARAKEQAERRQQQGNRPKKQQNDRRDGDRFQNRNERKNQGNDRRNQGNDRRRDQAGNGQGRPNPVNGAPKIDFKARAAALKAEQNAEYARGSEDRYKQQAAKAEQERQQRRKRVEVPEVKAPVQEKTVENLAKPAVAAAPAQVDTRRKKQARPDKKRDDFDREEDGPRKQQRNRSSQNQVRNQKNSNWNNNKKNKKGKNNRNEAPKPVTERKFHELPSEFEYTDGMTVAEIAKRIKREPA